MKIIDFGTITTAVVTLAGLLIISFLVLLVASHDRPVVYGAPGAIQDPPPPFPSDPTPFPTYEATLESPPPPDYTFDEPLPDESEIEPLPTADPNGPRNRVINGLVLYDVPQFIEYSDIIARGTITEIESAKWTTADGQRPDRPFETDDTIVTPMTFEVSEYLLGEKEERSLSLVVTGGVVGEDSLRQHPIDYNSYKENEEIIVFLIPSLVDTEASESQKWSPFMMYVVDANGIASNTLTEIYGPLSVEELRQRIQETQ